MFNFVKCFGAETRIKLSLLCLQVEIYEDKDNARKDEIAALGGQTAAGTNVFSAFYDRLKEVYYSLTVSK